MAENKLSPTTPLQIKIYTTAQSNAPTGVGEIVFDQASRKIGINGEWYQTSAQSNDFENLGKSLDALVNSGYLVKDGSNYYAATGIASVGNLMGNLFDLSQVNADGATGFKSVSEALDALQAINQAAHDELAQDIAKNATGIYENTVAIEGITGWAYEGIAKNATAIAVNATAIAGVSSFASEGIAKNATAIAANATAIAGITGWASEGIAANSTAIAGVSAFAASGIAANASGIAANASGIAANASGIAALSEQLAQAVTDTTLVLSDANGVTGATVRADGTEYTLKQGNTVVGKFNIIKDSFVKQGSIVWDDASHDGSTSSNAPRYATRGEVPAEITSPVAYIKLELVENNGSGTDSQTIKTVYIPANTLVDTYESGSGDNDIVTIVVDNDTNEISATFNIEEHSESSVAGTTNIAITATNVTGLGNIKYAAVDTQVTVTTEDGQVKGVSTVPVNVDVAGAAQIAYNTAVAESTQYTDTQVESIISWIVE